MPEREIAIRMTTLSDQGRETDLIGTSAEERLAMMWQLAVDAWEMKGEPIEPRLSRHVVRVATLKDK